MSQLSLSFKDRILSIHQLNQHEDFIIGSSPDCNIHIDSLAVNPHHAKIVYMDHAYVIEELEDESNIWVNERKVDASIDLHDGDHIRVGKHTLVFTFDERNEAKQQRVEPPPPIVKPHVSGWLQYLNGPELGKTMQIKKGMANIADPNEDNVALISSRSDGFYISYLKGEKPPKVNNTSIGEEHSKQLENNCKITIGKMELLFYTE